MQTAAPIHIGTSDWSYRHWKGPFYPDHLSRKGMLPYYADQQPAVEINNSFYQLPDKYVLIDWRRSVPTDFHFAVKANHYITHMKKLKDPRKSLQRFLHRITALGPKLGPILFQLPPHWQLNLDRLHTFLRRLPRLHRYTFEFRDPADFVYVRLHGPRTAYQG